MPSSPWGGTNPNAGGGLTASSPALLEKARPIRLGETVHLLTTSGKYLEVSGDDIQARNRSGLQQQRFVVCPYLNSQVPDMAEEPFPKRKLANTATFKGMVVRDGDAICLMASNGYFLGITQGEEEAEPSGRRVVKADFPVGSVPPCAMVMRTASRSKEVLDGQGVFLQSLASAQLLCFDDAFAAKMEPKQPPGELRQIGFQEEQQLIIQALPRPRRWKVNSISLEGELLKWPEVGVRVRQATVPTQFGMTVDTDVCGWVKVKWDHGAEEKCRVGAEGTYDLLVISLPSFTASGAGGLGKACNGQYVRVGCHNGMPKYRQERGDAIMFFEDDGWKMNCQDDTRQWVYQHLDSGASLPPLGRWAVAVGGPNPSPLLQATAAKAAATEARAIPRAVSPKVIRRKSPSAKKKGKEEFPAAHEPEVIRLGDFVYLRGNGRFLQAEGATVSASRTRADQECQRFLVCPYLNEHKEADAMLHSPETQKLVSTKTFRGRKVKDGDAICLMACSGCFLGITGQVDGSVTVGILHGRRWVKADFSEAAPACAMVIKTAGKRREVRDGEPFYLQSMASSQLLVVDEKAHVAVTMQSKQPPGDLMSGPKPHQELSFKKLPRSAEKRQVPPPKVLLKWCAVGVRVRHIDEPERGEGITVAAEDLPGFMKVRWDNGEETLCHVGADGKYSLYVVEPVARIEPVVDHEEKVVEDRPFSTPVLELGTEGARSSFRTRASDPLQVCFRFPSSIMKTIKEETWMGRKRYGKTAGYLVQVDVGLIRQQKLRPEETLPNKQISCDFRCGAPQRVQLSSKEQLVKIQLHPKFFNVFGLAEVAVCLVVMDYSRMSHQYWTLVSYSMVSVFEGTEAEEKGETIPK